MKLKVEYSTIVRDKMKDLKQYLTESFGNKVAVNVLKKITFALRSLSDFPEKGVSVSELFGVDTDFRCLYVKQNYFFYYIDDKCTFAPIHDMTILFSNQNIRII